jgi:hypothetical protein
MLNMRHSRLSWFAVTVALFLRPAAVAQTTHDYSAAREFMKLFFDFTGSEEPDYPAGQLRPARWCWWSAPIFTSTNRLAARY